MKAEDKILELLAEYLLKTDRLLDRMEKTDKQVEKTTQQVEKTTQQVEKTTQQVEQTNKSVEIMSRAIAEHSLKFNTVQEDIIQLQKAQNRIQQENGILIQELLTLSKRVDKTERRD